MRDVPDGDQSAVVTTVNGETRIETHVSFSSVTVINGDVQVNTVDASKVDLLIPGLNGTLRFDLDAVRQVEAQVERQPVVIEDPSLSPLYWKNLLITAAVWVVVSWFAGGLGFFAAAGYFWYQWRQVDKRKKRLVAEPIDQPPASPAQNHGAKMSPASVRKALARKP